MGNDGGSIPTRRELVKEAARLLNTTETKELQQEQQEHHWSTCPLSHQPLKPPIVSDSSGKLFNKDAILSFLLPSDDPATAATKSDTEVVLGGRVKGIRDIVEVKFQVEVDTETKKVGRVSPKVTKWVCPISNKALGPGVKAVYLVPCGHAFSESAVREVSGDKCLQCNESYTPDNVINILPIVAADIERLVIRAQKLKELGLTHSLKKAAGSGKKRKKAEATETNLLNSADTATRKTEKHLKVAPKPDGTITPSGGIKNAATASLTAKVLAEEQEKAKRRKLGENENLKSLFSSGKSTQKDGDFMTRGYIIPSNARR